VAHRLLAAAGLRPGDDVDSVSVDPGQANEALASGRIDAYFRSAQVPDSLVAASGKAVPVRLVRLDSGVIAALTRTFRPSSSMYAPADIPARAYRLDAAVRTISVPNYLVVNPSMQSQLAYRITRLMFQHEVDIGAFVPQLSRLSLQTAIETGPVPLHPGAAQYYRQIRP
jgi:TRAP transporter TAXI family solute receptor